MESGASVFRVTGGLEVSLCGADRFATVRSTWPPEAGSQTVPAASEFGRWMSTLDLGRKACGIRCRRASGLTTWVIVSITNNGEFSTRGASIHVRGSGRPHDAGKGQGDDPLSLDGERLLIKTM